MSESSPLPTPTAIRRFLRDTARNIQNDLTTSIESLDDFLENDPQAKPKEAGESAQIVVMKIEGAKAKVTQLITFMEQLKAAEIAQSVEARQGVANAFEEFKAALEASNSTSRLLN